MFLRVEDARHPKRNAARRLQFHQGRPSGSSGVPIGAVPSERSIRVRQRILSSNVTRKSRAVLGRKRLPLIERNDDRPQRQRNSCRK